MKNTIVTLSLGAGLNALVSAFPATADNYREVVVTATKTERQLDYSLTSISVVDSESIRRQQPREFSELLRGRPGVDVISNGPYGKATSVYMRGTSNDQNLMLLDGIRMGSATSGGPSWQFLPPQLIDRVEIVRGPRSSIYGADAIGGVIQVFTPEGEGEPPPWAQVGGGSDSTHEYGAGITGQSGNTAYSIGGYHYHTDGIALRRGGERKGFYNSSGLARLKHEFDNGVELGFTGLRSEGRTEFIDGDTDFIHQGAGASLRVPVTDQWTSRLNLSESRDESENRLSFGNTRFDTKRRMASWLNTIEAGDHEFVVGADYRDDRVNSTTRYQEDSRTNTGAFAQALLDFSPLNLELGVRHDDNEAYGTTTTANAAVGYQFDDNHRLRLTWGEGFRAPTFNELYFPGFGNPDLDPEDSRTIELGFSAHHQNWFWETVAYETKVDNLIQTVFAGGVFLPENVAEARIRGLEFGTGAELGDWTLYGALTYTDPENRETGNRLRRRAKESARLEVDRRFGDWALGATLTAQGKRYNDADGQERLSGFGLLNLRASWRFADNWSTRLTVENALDKDYVTARDSFGGFDYLQPGRSVFLTVRYGRD